MTRKEIINLDRQATPATSSYLGFASHEITEKKQSRRKRVRIIFQITINLKNNTGLQPLHTLPLSPCRQPRVAIRNEEPDTSINKLNVQEMDGPRRVMAVRVLKNISDADKECGYFDNHGMKEQFCENLSNESATTGSSSSVHCGLKEQNKLGLEFEHRAFVNNCTSGYQVEVHETACNNNVHAASSWERSTNGIDTSNTVTEGNFLINDSMDNNADKEQFCHFRGSSNAYTETINSQLKSLIMPSCMGNKYANINFTKHVDEYNQVPLSSVYNLSGDKKCDHTAPNEGRKQLSHNISIGMQNKDRVEQGTRNNAMFKQSMEFNSSKNDIREIGSFEADGSSETFNLDDKHGAQLEQETGLIRGLYQSLSEECERHKVNLLEVEEKCKKLSTIDAIFRKELPEISSKAGLHPKAFPLLPKTETCLNAFPSESLFTSESAIKISINLEESLQNVVKALQEIILGMLNDRDNFHINVLAELKSGSFDKLKFLHLLEVEKEQYEKATKALEGIKQGFMKCLLSYPMSIFEEELEKANPELSQKNRTLRDAHGSTCFTLLQDYIKVAVVAAQNLLDERSEMQGLFLAEADKGLSKSTLQILEISRLKNYAIRTMIDKMMLDFGHLQGATWPSIGVDNDTMEGKPAKAEPLNLAEESRLDLTSASSISQHAMCSEKKLVPNLNSVYPVEDLWSSEMRSTHGTGKWRRSTCASSSLTYIAQDEADMKINSNVLGISSSATTTTTSSRQSLAEELTSDYDMIQSQSRMSMLDDEKHIGAIDIRETSHIGQDGYLTVYHSPIFEDQQESSDERNDKLDYSYLMKEGRKFGPELSAFKKACNISKLGSEGIQAHTDKKSDEPDQEEGYVDKHVPSSVEDRNIYPSVPTSCTNYSVDATMEEESDKGEMQALKETIWKLYIICDEHMAKGSRNNKTEVNEKTLTEMKFADYNYGGRQPHDPRQFKGANELELGLAIAFCEYEKVKSRFQAEKARNADYEKTNTFLRQRIRNGENQIKELLKSHAEDIKHNESSLSGMEELNLQLQCKISKTESSLALLRADHGNLRSLLETKCEKSKEEVVSLTQTIDHLKEELSLKQTELADIEQYLEQKYMQVEELEGKLLVQARETLLQKDHYIKKANEANRETDEQRRRVHDLIAINGDLLLFSQTKERELVSIKSAREKLEQVVKEKEEKTLNLEQDMENIKNQLYQAKEEGNSLASKNEWLQSKLRATAEKLSEQEDALNRLNSDFALTVDGQSAILKGSEQLYRLVKGSECDKDDELRQSRLIIKDLEEKLMTMGKAIHNRTVELTKVNRQYDSMKKAVEGRGEEVHFLKNEVGVLRWRIQELEEEVMEKDGQIAILRAPLADS